MDMPAANQMGSARPTSWSGCCRFRRSRKCRCAVRWLIALPARRLEVQSW